VNLNLVPTEAYSFGEIVASTRTLHSRSAFFDICLNSKKNSSVNGLQDPYRPISYFALTAAGAVPGCEQGREKYA